MADLMRTDKREVNYDGSAASAEAAMDIFGTRGTLNTENGLMITLPPGTKIIQWLRSGDVELEMPTAKGSCDWYERLVFESAIDPQGGLLCSACRWEWIQKRKGLGDA
jgi:hypothetical protein